MQVIPDWIGSVGVWACCFTLNWKRSKMKMKLFTMCVSAYVYMNVQKFLAGSKSSPPILKFRDILCWNELK